MKPLNSPSPNKNKLLRVQQHVAVFGPGVGVFGRCAGVGGALLNELAADGEFRSVGAQNAEV